MLPLKKPSSHLLTRDRSAVSGKAHNIPAQRFRDDVGTDSMTYLTRKGHTCVASA